jgi:hypothetical protein
MDNPLLTPSIASSHSNTHMLPYRLWSKEWGRGTKVADKMEGYVMINRTSKLFRLFPWWIASYSTAERNKSKEDKYTLTLLARARKMFREPHSTDKLALLVLF